MPKRLITYSQTQPARAILTVVAVLTLLATVGILLPFYTPSTLGPAASAAFSIPAYLGGGLNLVATLPALWGLKRNTPTAIARGAFWLSIWYLFVSLVRIIFAGATLSFVPTLIVCLVMAIVYIEQSFVAKGKQVVKEVVIE